MRQGAVYMNGKLAGILTEISPTEYVFKYDDTYYADDMQPAVSLTLPKTQQEYRSAYLFPFFSNMLSEGRNRIVRRMFETVGHPVRRLSRTAVGPVRLGQLRVGELRELSRDELGALMDLAGL